MNVTLILADEILKLWHTTDIITLRSWDKYLLSQDRTGFWHIWDMGTKTPVLSGNTPVLFNSVDFIPTVDLNNGTLMIIKKGSFDIYYIPELVPKTIEADSIDSLRLMKNGDYIWAGSTTNLRVWNKNGQKVLTIAGDYLRARLSADSTRLFVAVTGADSLNCYSLQNFAFLSTVHFTGDFHSWISDGKRFLTQQNYSIVRTYDVDGTREGLQDVGSTENLAGYGSYFWTLPSSYPDYPLRIYRVGLSDTPEKIVNTGPFTQVICRNSYLGFFLYGKDTLSVIKLVQDSMQVSKFCGPGAYILTFESDQNGNWFSGNRSGVINYSRGKESPKYLNYGKLRAIAGSSVGKFAVTTSSGQILIFQKNGVISTLVDSIQHNSSAIQFSSNGSIIASQTNTLDAQYTIDCSSLFLFNTLTHVIVKYWRYSLNHELDDYYLREFDLSQNGRYIYQRIGSFQNSSWSYKKIIYDIEKDSEVETTDDSLVTRISPNGNLTAIQGDRIIKIYKGKQLVNALDGNFGGWFNDEKIIVNRYVTEYSTYRKDDVFKDSYLIDTSGKIDSSIKFTRPVSDPVIISDTEILIPDANRSFSIYNMHSGRKMFTTDTSIFLATAVNDLVIYQNSTSLNTIDWRQNQLSIHPDNLRKYYNDPIKITRNTLNVTFSLQRKESVNIILYSLDGALINSISMGNFNRGNHNICVPLALAFGGQKKYGIPLIAVLKTDKIIASKKLINMH